MLFTNLSFSISANAGANSDTNIPGPSSTINDQNTAEHRFITEPENKQSGALNSSATDAHRKIEIMILEVVSLLISLAIAIAAFISAHAARTSARMAERLAKSAINYSLTPLNPEIKVSLDPTKQIPEGYRTTIDFHNSGNQTVLIHNPVWDTKSQNTVKVSVIKMELCLGQTVIYELDHSTVPVIAGFTAKIHLRFTLGYHFEEVGSCEGTLYFSIDPTLDNGLDAIEIPCRFNIRNKVK